MGELELASSVPIAIDRRLFEGRRIEQKLLHIARKHADFQILGDQQSGGRTGGEIETIEVAVKEHLVTWRIGKASKNAVVAGGVETAAWCRT